MNEFIIIVEAILGQHDETCYWNNARLFFSNNNCETARLLFILNVLFTP
jgi:hypothetical protein